MKAKSFCVPILTLLPILAAACNRTEVSSNPEYYGVDSRQAAVDFTTTVLIPWDQPFHEDDMRDVQSNLYKQVMEGVNKQAEFIYAVFKEHHAPTNFALHPGAVKNRPSFKITSVTHNAITRSVTATYQYHNIGAFQRDLFASAGPLQIAFRLPENPYSVYTDGLVPMAQALAFYHSSPWALTEIQKAQADGEKTFNLCTNVEYNTEGDYWYFWNPDLPGCPIAGRRDTIMVNGVLTPSANTLRSFPEYNRLATDQAIRIKYLVGINTSFGPDDLGVQGLAKTFHLLTQGKKVLEMPESAITLTRGERTMLAATADQDEMIFKVNSDEPTRKQLQFDFTGLKAIVDMELYDPNSESFERAAVDGMRNYNVFIYNGHSGLGGYLGRDVLFKPGEKLDTGKYQIFFFNGCTTYAYYDQDYFDMKKAPGDVDGTKNLDIVTATIEADFSIGPGSDFMLIRDLLAGKASWQQIMNHMYAIDPNRSALIQVNGDENNPTEL